MIQELDVMSRIKMNISLQILSGAPELSPAISLFHSAIVPESNKFVSVVFGLR